MTNLQETNKPPGQKPPVRRSLMGSSQAFGTQAVDAALSDIGHLTSMFPDTQQIQGPGDASQNDQVGCSAVQADCV